jgi:thiaminase/transcriptional activator TenA
MNWSEQAWQEIAPIYKNILQMPFITQLMDGTLDIEKFQFYMAQDSAYLEHFGRALAVVGAKAQDIQDALTFMHFGANAIIVENALHESYFKDFGLTERGEIQPACHHYIHFLKSTAALDAVEVGMAALLPCFWIYKEVGDYIYSAKSHQDNPYQKWIETYAGEEFGNEVKKAIAICDRIASQTTPAVRSRMTEAFVTAARLEYDFWDAAYILRTW